MTTICLSLEEFQCSQSMLFLIFFARSITKIVYENLQFFVYARNVRTACCLMTAPEQKKKVCDYEQIEHR